MSSPDPPRTTEAGARDDVVGAPSENAQSEDAQSEDAQSENAQSENAQSENAQSEDAQSKNAQSETDRSGRSATEDAGPCPIVESIEQIGSRWRLVVLHELQDGERRFNELKRATDANSRTLSRVLDDLQELGFVSRRLEEDAPVATYYSLTAKGTSLSAVFSEIEEWAFEWLAECDT